jgi:hypothetical protein
MSSISTRCNDIDEIFFSLINNVGKDDDITLVVETVGFFLVVVFGGGGAVVVVFGGAIVVVVVGGGGSGVGGVELSCSSIQIRSASAELLPEAGKLDDSDRAASIAADVDNDVTLGRICDRSC